MKKKNKKKRKSRIAEASRKRLEDRLETPPMSMYRCLNCDHAYMDKPGPTSCPNPMCKTLDGENYPGNEEDHGVYVKWLNYDLFDVNR